MNYKIYSDKKSCIVNGYLSIDNYHSQLRKQHNSKSNQLI